jgi:hypothetical protein
MTVIENVICAYWPSLFLFITSLPGELPEALTETDQYTRLLSPVK